MAAGVARLVAAACFALVAFHLHPHGVGTFTLLGAGLTLLTLSFGRS